MGSMLSSPVTDKKSKQGEGQGLKYGLCSMQGWRCEMEDAHDVKIGLKYGLDNWSYFAVFDGHAGKRAAAFAALNLLEFIHRSLDPVNLPECVYIEPDLENFDEMMNIENISTNILPNTEQNQANGDETKISADSSSQDTKESDHNISENKKSSTSSIAQQETTSSSSPQSIRQESQSAQKTGEHKEDKQLEDEKSETLTPKSKFNTITTIDQLETIKSAIKGGFFEIDEKMRLTGQDMSGCTAICALISPSHLFIANCGDSRAVLYDGETHLKFATIDHKPFNPTERKRIILAGGCATQRVNGTLAVSRALGDFEFKKNENLTPCAQLVSPEPEVTVIPRSPKDKFLILACDGIWDVIGNDELCEFVNYKLQVEPDIEKVCSSVLDLCLHKNSRDNMSIIIIVFENGPKFSDEELEKDRKNDEALLAFVRERGDKKADFYDFLSAIKFKVTLEATDDEFHLPPGAGLDAKYDLLYELFVNEFELKADEE